MKRKNGLILSLAATLLPAVPAGARNTVLIVTPANVADPIVSQLASLQVEAAAVPTGEQFVVVVSANDEGHYFHRGQDLSPFLSADLLRGVTGLARSDTRGGQVVQRLTGKVTNDGAVLYRFTVRRRVLGGACFRINLALPADAPTVPASRLRSRPYHCFYYLSLKSFAISGARPPVVASPALQSPPAA